MIAFIIGGSGSGKSEYGENLAVRLTPGRKLYIATMYPWDEESRQKIKRHRNMRAMKQFDTIECFYDLTLGVKQFVASSTEPRTNTAFLDCMSNLVTNEMYTPFGYCNQQKNDFLVEYVLKGIDTLCEQFEHVIIVSNDTFSDGVEYNEEMQKFLANLASINTGIATRADVVVEVVCGIPILQKGEFDENIME